MLLGGAFRSMAPALALSLLDPKLTWAEEGAAAAAAGGAGAAGVALAHADGTPFSAYDLKRLQVRRRGVTGASPGRNAPRAVSRPPFHAKPPTPLHHSPGVRQQPG